MKIVVDMNLSRGWVSALSSSVIEAIHWSTIGAQDAADRVIMDWAQANGAVVLTRDLDFATVLTREGLSSPSVIQIRANRVTLARHLARLQDALERYADHIARGAVITIDDDRTRVRALD